MNIKEDLRLYGWIYMIGFIIIYSIIIATYCICINHNQIKEWYNERYPTIYNINGVQQENAIERRKQKLSNEISYYMKFHTHRIFCSDIFYNIDSIKSYIVESEDNHDFFVYARKVFRKKDEIHQRLMEENDPTDLSYKDLVDESLQYNINIVEINIMLKKCYEEVQWEFLAHCVCSNCKANTLLNFN